MSKSKNPAGSKTVNTYKPNIEDKNREIKNRMDKILEELTLSREALEKKIFLIGLFAIEKDLKAVIKETSNNAISKGNAKAAINLEYSPDYNELKEMAQSKLSGNGEILDVLMIMSKPKYFDAINDILNTALKAAGVDDCDKNFAKLYCVHNLAYPLKYYYSQKAIQRILTKDIFEMNNPGRELNDMISQFSIFSDLIDPDETGMLNVSDERLKEFMTA